MKKRISLFMAAIMVLTVMLSAIPIVAATNTFDANAANPTISTAEDYLAFFKAVYVDNNNFSGKTVTLNNDITVNDTAASDWYAKDGVVKMANSDDGDWSWFEGTFDGNGKTIRGVVIDKKFRNDLVIGLFPHARNATIKNLTVDGFYVSSNGAKATGGLIGRVGNGVTVDGVTLKNGTVNATNCNQENNQRGVGALIGYVYLDADEQKVNITNCTVDPSVRVTCDGTNWVGGIIGAIQLQNRNHAHISFKGSSFSTYDEDLSAVGYYNQNANDGYQLVLKIVDEGGNKWSGAGKEEKTDWVNETIGTFGIYSVVVVRFVGMQTRASDNGARFVGLIKAVDLEQISSLGFEITVGGKTVGPDVIKCTKVYASIVEDGTPLAAPEGYYYFTFVITGVADNTSFDVKACATVNGTNYVTAVGTCVYPPVEA